MINNANAMHETLLPYKFAKAWTVRALVAWVRLYFARSFELTSSRIRLQDKMAHERDSWRNLLVTELAGSVLNQCGLAEFLIQIRAASTEEEVATLGTSCITKQKHKKQV